MAIFCNLAYIRKVDWTRFLEIIDDPEKQHEKWEDWHKEYLKLKNSLIIEGFSVNDFEVNLDELINYCKRKKIKIDGKARSRFAAKQGLD